MENSMEAPQKTEKQTYEKLKIDLPDYSWAYTQRNINQYTRE
jgi:hypothetical protein